MNSRKYYVLSIKGRNTLILVLIIALGFFLRVWQTNLAPAGFNADEAAIGYNAYSLLKTGRDEYGQILPLSFKSFGDYKPGLYFYFVIPFVAIFGLGELAIRIPSMLLGTGTIILVYFLGKRIFNSQSVGLISALLLAISPWHIHFSRTGWETNAATFFITLGVLIFIQKVGDAKHVFFALLSFLISMYLYQSPRLVIPVLVLFLIIFYRKSFIPYFKKYLSYFVILVILTLPLGFQLFGGGASARFNGLSIFSDVGPENRINQLRGEHGDLGGKPAIIFHNKITAYGSNFLGHYLDHFSPDFLFINGDPIIRNKVPETGQFYLICSIFLIIGLFSLIRNRFEHTKLLLIWILVAPIASSITYQTPNAVRALNMVVPLTLIMGYGVWVMINPISNIQFQISNFKLKYITFGLIAIFLLFEVVHYLESYYIHYPKRYPLASEYGFSQMVPKLEQYQGGFDKVVITDRYDQPYILVLFYEKYDPAKYQPQANLSPRDKFNFGTVRSFDKYEFREIKPDEIKSAKKTLYIGTDKEIPKDANIIDEINFPDGSPAFIFAKT